MWRMEGTAPRRKLLVARRRDDDHWLTLLVALLTSRRDDYERRCGYDRRMRVATQPLAAQYS